MLPRLSRRSLRLLPILALPIAALAAGDAASASTTPPPPPPGDAASAPTLPPPPVDASAATPPSSAPTSDAAVEELPEGYVRLVDDTGFLTVVVPEAWAVVDTALSANAGDSPQAGLFASVAELTEFNDTFASGVLYLAAPYEADPEAFLAGSGLSAGCETIEVQPYSDPIFTGSVQVGTNCGTDGGSWNMIVASPQDQSFTAIVQLQISSSDEQEAFDIVLQSFTYAGDPTVPPGMMVPSSSVPGSSVPG